MRINWQRLGILGISILVIAGILLIAISWDPTGIIEEENSIVHDIFGVIFNSFLVIVIGFISLIILGGICTGIYHIFKWVTDVPELNSAPQPEFPPMPEVAPALESELLKEPEPPELDEVIPRTSLLDLS